MKAFRLLCASLAVAVAAPVAAQDNASQPAANETIGPRELQNFNLEGRVTRPADAAAQPVANPPAAPAPQADSPQPATRESSTPATRSEQRAERATQSAAPPLTVQSDDVLARRPSLPDTRRAARNAAAPETTVAAATTRPSLVTPDQKESSSLLVWVAALLFAGGIGTVYWFLRHGRRPAMAGGYVRNFERSAPQPQSPAPPRQSTPKPALRAPSPPAGEEALVRRPLPTTLRPKHDAPVSGTITAGIPPTKPVGIVASNLRPWIEVELDPDRALVDDSGAAIAFHVTLVNSGSAPARDVSIEACLLNAGARQDADLSEFFERPQSSSDSIPMIAPMARVPLRTAVKIPRDMIQEYEVEGRKLFMPMVAVSTRYRWSSGEGQTGAGFLVGKGQDQQERLTPFRIDRGARSWKGLGARRYEKGLRR